MQMKITALLPMKSHSERVPNKNMRLFAGHPLFHAVAKILQASNMIDCIIVNTDSPGIAQSAIENFPKVVIHDRPKEIQGDYVSMNTIIGHDLLYANGEHFLQTHSTNPLLTRDTIESAITYYFNNLKSHDSLFSVTRLQNRLYWADGCPINHNPKELIRTQDLPPVFEENSNIFLFSRTSFFASGGNRMGTRPLMFEMNKLEAVDIDEEDDFILAETLYIKRG